jgi:protein ImuA
MMSATPQAVRALRTKLAALERPALLGASDLFSFGLSAVDQPLGGGLERGAVHEVFADGPADAASAGGFALALALRAARDGRIVWVRQDFVDVETGRLHGAGLAAFGLDPGKLVLVRARDAADVLRAGGEAGRCAALGAVLIEPWGDPKVLDLNATRRLALTAAASRVTTFLVRVAAAPVPSAASTRWSVHAAQSRPLEANAPGFPAFALTLLRHRAGVPPRHWCVEWNRDSSHFQDRTRPLVAPLPRRLVAVPAGRPLEEGEPLRRAG